MERSEECFPRTGGLRTVIRPIKREMDSVFMSPAWETVVLEETIRGEQPFAAADARGQRAPDCLLVALLLLGMLIEICSAQSRKHYKLDVKMKKCVCFFVLCDRHWFNRVPGTNLGIACLPPPLQRFPVQGWTRDGC
jgi:hypothetical protein